MTADEDGEITEAIEQLRSQLTAVQEGSKEAKLRFVVAEVEMEFLVEVTRGRRLRGHTAWLGLGRCRRQDVKGDLTSPEVEAGCPRHRVR